MTTGPGNQEVRKIQITGGATFTMSLPKPWIKAHQLGARDGVRVDWRPSGALRLTPLKEINKTTQVILDNDLIPDGALYDHLMAAYLSGVERIEIRLSSENKREQRRILRIFLRSTRGLEISDESDEIIILISLLRSGELPINSSLNQMYLQLTSLIRDAIEVMSGAEKELIEDHDEREREVDGLHHLIQRQLGAMLSSHKVARSLGLDRRQSVEYANLARSLERMMDHAQQLAILIFESESLPIFESSKPPMQQLPLWQTAIKALMVNLRTRDAGEIEIARDMLKTAQITLKKYEEGLWGERKQVRLLLLEYRISESTRRLCAYARDFGETLLNMMIYDRMIVDIQE